MFGKKATGECIGCNKRFYSVAKHERHIEAKHSKDFFIIAVEPGDGDRVVLYPNNDTVERYPINRPYLDAILSHMLDDLTGDKDDGVSVLLKQLRDAP